MLPGVHRVRSKLASGQVAIYWYAWRGGPRILSVRGHESALDGLVRRAAPEAAKAYQAAHDASRAPADGFIAGLVHRYLMSPEFASKAERTQRDRRRHLDVVRETLGDMSLRALEARGARSALLNWRNKWAATPRTADHYMDALALALSWARDQGLTDADPLREWPRLYRANRSEVVWTPEDLAALLKHASPMLGRAIRLAAYSGLRQGDLLRLPWSAVTDKAVMFSTAKRGRLVVIPMTPELRAVLDECPRVSPIVLTGDRGRPVPVVTLNRQFREARSKAGITGKTWHDMRGTFATHLARRGLPEDEIARIVGWEPKKVREIIVRYVTGEALAEGMLARLTPAG